MKIKNIGAITIFFIMLLFSCSSKSDSIRNKLVGTWVLDSISSVRVGFYKDSNERKILIFKEKNNYSFESWNGDVGNVSKGNYFILKNPNRKNFTIAFIPDLQIGRKDTIRSYMNLDIISLSDTSLKVVDQTRFIERDSLPHIVKNTQYIYRLHK